MVMSDLEIFPLGERKGSKSKRGDCSDHVRENIGKWDLLYRGKGLFINL
jgi:hypothetical protein